MDADRLLDRVLSLAPLGVLIYLARRHDSERRAILELLDRDRDAFRNERRELINRVQHPAMIPTGARPVGPPEPRSRAAHAADDPARAAFNGVGRAAMPAVPRLPRDGDELPE